MNFRSDLMNTNILQTAHVIYGDAWVLWSSWLWMCLSVCIKCHWSGFQEPDPPAWRRSLPFPSQGGDCGFLRPHEPVQSSSVWSQAFVFFFSPVPSLAQVSPSAHTSLNSTPPACRGQNTNVTFTKIWYYCCFILICKDWTD